MYNIVTFVCIDSEEEDGKIDYPTLNKMPFEERRIVYWKNAATLCCSSIRLNPEKKHIIYTNDKNTVFINKSNLYHMLSEINIEVRHLPFRLFKPPVGSSRRFKNVFYRYEILKHLGLENNPSIVLDSDSIWTCRSETLDQLMFSDCLLLQDTYQRTNKPYSKEPHNLSMIDMGNLFRRINPSYPEPAPVWYGGEVIGGTGRVLKLFAEQAEEIFTYFVKNFINGKNFIASNGVTVFDSSEFVFCYVSNSGLFKIVDLYNKFSKRIWTLQHINNVSPDDIKITIWHLPGEKNLGLSLLFEEICKKDSQFWTTKPEIFNEYLGQFVGVPERKDFVYFELLKYRIINFSELNLEMFKLKERPSPEITENSLKVLEILKSLSILPVIIPNSDGTINFEYKKEDTTFSINVCNRSNFLIEEKNSRENKKITQIQSYEDLLKKILN